MAVFALVLIAILGQKASAQNVINPSANLDNPTGGYVGSPPNYGYWVRATGLVDGGNQKQWQSFRINVKIERTTAGKAAFTTNWGPSGNADANWQIHYNFDTTNVPVATDPPAGGDTYNVTVTAYLTDRNGVVTTVTSTTKVATVMPGP